MQLQQRKLETGLARGWETEPDTAYASVRLSLVLDAGLPEVCLCTGPRPYWLQNTGGEGCTGEGLWFQTLTQLAGLLLLVSRRFPALSNRRQDEFTSPRATSPATALAAIISRWTLVGASSWVSLLLPGCRLPCRWSTPHGAQRVCQ